MLDLNSIFPIQNSLYERQVIRSQVYIGLAAILVAIWIPFDFSLDPKHFYFFLILRIIYILFCIICLYAYYKKLKINYYWLFMANYCLLILLLGIMVILANDFYAYLFGYSTIFIGAAALLLWDYRSILCSYIIVAAQILLGYPIYSENLSDMEIIGGGFFLLNVLSITVIAVYLSHKSAIKIDESTRKLILLEKRESINTLVSGIAHEINTPLEAINSLSSLTGKKLELILSALNNSTLIEKEFRHNLQKLIAHTSIVNKQSTHAANLITEFKAVSVDQHHENEKEFFNLKEQIERLLSTILHKTKKYQVNIKLDCDNDITIYSYPGDYFQLFTNLINNSLTHAFSDTQQKKINIKAELTKEALNFIYTDNGKGIEKPVLHKIYDPFFTTNRGKGGSGLGMYIVYNIVTQKLHGTIGCDSEEKNGVTFSIKIPRQELVN